MKKLFLLKFLICLSLYGEAQISLRCPICPPSGAGIPTGYVLTLTGANSAAWDATGLGATYWTDTLGHLYPTTLSNNVGIGTATPSAKLNVVGNAVINGGTDAEGIFANNVNAQISDIFSLTYGMFTSDKMKFYYGYQQNFQSTGYDGIFRMAVDTVTNANYIDYVGVDNSTHGNGMENLGFWANGGDGNFTRWWEDTLGFWSYQVDSAGDSIKFGIYGEKAWLYGNTGHSIFQIKDGTQAAGRYLGCDANGNAAWKSFTPANDSAWGIHGNLVDTSMFFGSKNPANLTFKDTGNFAAEIGIDTFNNTFFGIGAGANAQGYALQYSGLNRGGKNNVGIGRDALEGNLSASGNYCTAVGVGALVYDTAFGNTAVGYFAGVNNITGAYNTAVGFAALLNTVNNSNVGVGDSALASLLNGKGNTAVGGAAGDSVGNCNGCTFVGYNANVPAGSGTLTNATAVGSNTIVAQSNAIVLGGTGVYAVNVGVGTTTPDASAALDIESTTRGVLLPQMTTTQKNAISSPKEGLMVYDLTLHGVYFWNGSAWLVP